MTCTFSFNPQLSDCIVLVFHKAIAASLFYLYLLIENNLHHVSKAHDYLIQILTKVKMKWKKYFFP